MEFLKTILKRVAQAGDQAGKPMANVPIVASKHSRARQRRGAAAEALACGFLERQGLQLLARNYRTPGRGGGEIDLIMLEQDGTVVFVEVRLRSRSDFGGAAASVDPRKQRRIVLAARHYLLGYAGAEPPCRFDVVVIQGQGQEQASSTTALAAMPSAPADQLEWLKAAFDAGSA